jgi:hypothetical protein
MKNPDLVFEPPLTAPMALRVPPCGTSKLMMKEGNSEGDLHIETPPHIFTLLHMVHHNGE